MAVISSIELKPHEKILREIRRFPVVDTKHYVIAFVFMLVPFFFLFPLLKWGVWGMVGGGLLFVIGCWVFIRTLFMWYHNVFVITTERIIDIDQRGFFERVVSQSSWEKIQDISVHIHGPVQTFFRYGDVNIKTAWGSVELCVPSIFRPNKVQRDMLEAQEHYLEFYARGSRKY